MTDIKIKQILEDVRRRRLSVEKAMEQLKYLPFKDIGFAKIDTHRSLRRGIPEIIYGPSKTVDELIKIVRLLYRIERQVIITRLDSKKARLLKKRFPRGKFFGKAGIFFIGKKIKPASKSMIGVITAGSGDRTVAEEAAIICEIFGHRVKRFFDIGVAGIHRLIASYQAIDNCRVLIVVAGMDGALPSVIGGLVGKPIIAVPTSVGYGANFQGLAPLLTMLNSCAPGVAVVNIDNGFGAGYLASLINSL
ncbi:MAG: nickel pincer cofactor biosynthesis protein LarB [candidate division WOR-3 bacterium]